MLADEEKVNKALEREKKEKERHKTLTSQCKDHVRKLGSSVNTKGMDCGEKSLFPSVTKARFGSNLKLSEIRPVI
jgi:hypothetical protein